jgi:hypothetical protein
LREALALAGVSPGFVRGAKALFLEGRELQVDLETKSVAVVTRRGRMTVMDAVQHWFGEDGKAFVPEPEPPAHFSAQIIELRAPK